MELHVRYKTPWHCRRALAAYNRNSIDAKLETYGMPERDCRDIRVTVADINQERLGVRIDTKYKGYTYTPYDKNSEW